MPWFAKCGMATVTTLSMKQVDTTWRILKQQDAVGPIFFRTYIETDVNIFGLWHLLQCRLQTSITNRHTHANKYFYCLRSLFRTKRVHSNPVAIVLADDTPSRTSNPHYDNTDPATTSGITTTLKPTSTSTAPRATSAKPCMSLHFPIFHAPVKFRVV